LLRDNRGKGGKGGRVFEPEPFGPAGPSEVQVVLLNLCKITQIYATLQCLHYNAGFFYIIMSPGKHLLDKHLTISLQYNYNADLHRQTNATPGETFLEEGKTPDRNIFHNIDYFGFHLFDIGGSV